VCPGCGYRYPDRATDCPSLATVRPVLYRRRVEDGQAIAQLTPDQYADLHGRTNARTRRVAVWQAAQPTPSPDRHAPNLFDLIAGNGIDGKDSPS
jgi:hypothetical protein